MGVQRGRLLGRIAVLERGGAGLEERVVGLGVGGGDHQQVVLEPELGAHVPALGSGGVQIHHGAEPVGECGRGGEQQRAHREDADTDPIAMHGGGGFLSRRRPPTGEWFVNRRAGSLAP